MAGRGGGRGYDEGPPDFVVEAGTFAHACEGEAVVKFTIGDKVSYTSVVYCATIGVTEIALYPACFLC